MAPFQHILVAVDFGAPSAAAIDFAVDLARAFAAELTLVHAYEIPAYAYPGVSFALTADLLMPVEETARKQLLRVLDQVRERVPAARAILRTGTPATEILATVGEIGPDLVVVGTHGRTGVARVVLGSVAEKVVRLSPVPVLTVGGSRVA